MCCGAGGLDLRLHVEIGLHEANRHIRFGQVLVFGDEQPKTDVARSAREVAA